MGGFSKLECGHTRHALLAEQLHRRFKAAAHYENPLRLVRCSIRIRQYSQKELAGVDRNIARGGILVDGLFVRGEVGPLPENAGMLSLQFRSGAAQKRNCKALW